MIFTETEVLPWNCQRLERKKEYTINEPSLRLELPLLPAADEEDDAALFLWPLCGLPAAAADDEDEDDEGKSGNSGLALM